MLRRDIEVSHREGLHARPAALLVQTANRFASQLLIEQGNKKVNAKSIMGVLSLGVSMGQVIHVIANGPDEKEAIEALTRLAESDFEEMPDAL